jgi:hypothetical protein
MGRRADLKTRIFSPRGYPDKRGGKIRLLRKGGSKSGTCFQDGPIYIWPSWKQALRTREGSDIWGRRPVRVTYVFSLPHGLTPPVGGRPVREAKSYPIPTPPKGGANRDSRIESLFASTSLSNKLKNKFIR